MSLKVRLTLLTVGIIAIVIVAVSWVAYHELRESLAKEQDAPLASLVERVQARLAKLPAGASGQELAALLAAVAPTRGSQVFLWREDGGQERAVSNQPGGQAVLRSLTQSGAQWPVLGHDRHKTLTADGHLYRGMWSRRQTAAGVVSVVVAAAIPYAEHEMQEFLLALLGVGGGMLVLAGVLSVPSVSWAMRPIRLTARRLQYVTHRNLGAEHLADLAVPAELVPFVDALGAMLSRVNEGVQAQKRFVSDASHELRTPLALAKSTIQAACLQPRTPREYCRALAELLEDVDRMNHLVTQLLDLARLDENRAEPVEAVEVGDVLGQLARRYHPQAAAGGGRIICQVADGTLAVRASPTDMESLFGNLIDNALKYGPRNGTVTVKAHADDGRCIASVHDQGGGVAPDQIDMLFDRFCRADQSRSRTTGGSGLGLAIARTIALRYGGEIRMTSSPPEGTTVSVRLPLGQTKPS